MNKYSFAEKMRLVEYIRVHRDKFCEGNLTVDEMSRVLKQENFTIPYESARKACRSVGIKLKAKMPPRPDLKADNSRDPEGEAPASKMALNMKIKYMRRDMNALEDRVAQLEEFLTSKNYGAKAEPEDSESGEFKTWENPPF